MYLYAGDLSTIMKLIVIIPCHCPYAQFAQSSFYYALQLFLTGPDWATNSPDSPAPSQKPQTKP